MIIHRIVIVIDNVRNNNIIKREVIMTIDFISTILGLCGVILVLVAYVLLQSQRLSQTSPSFYLVNIIGSLFILFSLVYHWNTPSVVIEIAWLVISVLGLCRYYFLSFSK